MTLPASAFETTAAQSLSITTSQLRFMICLLGCIPVGWLQGQIRHVTSKANLVEGCSTGVGQVRICLRLSVDCC